MTNTQCLSDERAVGTLIYTALIYDSQTVVLPFSAGFCDVKSLTETIVVTFNRSAVTKCCKYNTGIDTRHVTSLTDCDTNSTPPPPVYGLPLGWETLGPTFQSRFPVLETCYHKRRRIPYGSDRDLTSRDRGPLLPFCPADSI